MHFRTILSGTLALLILGGAAAAAPTTSNPPAEAPRGLFGLFDRKSPEPVRTAQVSDPTVMQLQEQLRSLNGRVEELNFQILQMQEQIRKMQEDNEFRLQELEKKAGMAGASKDRNVADAGAADTQTTASAGDATAPDAAAGPARSGENTASASSGAPSGTASGTGEPPQTFGTITVDKDGNVIATTVDPPVDLLPGKAGKQSGGVDVAALPTTNDPEELYRNSYQFILSGDYSNAETGFRDHISRFPKDGKAADANYWLGEALLGQQKYRDAAEVFLAANKQYPKSKKAPDMLLKLGVALSGMNQKDVACATFSEVGKRYPNAPDALKQRVKQEQAHAAC